MSWISSKQAADVLGVSQRRIQQRVSEDSLRSKRDDAGNLLIWIDERDRQVSPPEEREPKDGKRKAITAEGIIMLYDLHDGLLKLRTEWALFFRDLNKLIKIYPGYYFDDYYGKLPDITEYRKLLLAITQAHGTVGKMAESFRLDSKNLQAVHGELCEIEIRFFSFFPKREKFINEEEKHEHDKEPTDLVLLKKMITLCRDIAGTMAEVEKPRSPRREGFHSSRFRSEFIDNEN